MVTYAYTQKPEAGIQSSQPGRIMLSKELSAVPHTRLASKVTVSNFNDLYIGDLAYLTIIIGTNNSDSHYCLIRDSIAAEFNCPRDRMVPRAAGFLRIYLGEHKDKVASAKKEGIKTIPANYRVVNSNPLVEVDPKHIVVPIPHCPMGLVCQGN